MNVLAAGDCGVDRYLDLRADRAGGISLNFAVNARLQFPSTADVGVVSALGSDDGAELVESVFAQYGIEPHLQTATGSTPVQYIDRHPNGEKIFPRYEAGILAGQRVDERQRRAIADSDLMIAAYYPDVERFIDSVMRSPSEGLRCVDFGALTATDDRLRMVKAYLDRLELAFFGLSDDQTALIAELEMLARSHSKLFIVTLAAEGSIALGGEERLHCDAMPVEKVVDTTGAGDTFIAGFLSEYAYTRNIQASLQCGSRAAAGSVCRVGAFDSPLVPWC